MVGKAIVRQALKSPFPWLIVKFAVDLWKLRITICIFPIAPTNQSVTQVTLVSVQDGGIRGSNFIPELKILVSGEVHDHESTASPPSTAPVLSQNGCKGPYGSSRANIKK